MLRLNPQCDAVWGGDSVMKMEALTNGISAFIKGTPEISLTPAAIRRHSEKMIICELESDLSPDANFAST